MSFKYMLRQGDKGQEVARLQSKVGARVDGDYGPNTKFQVENYQEKYQELEIDGIAGPKTLGLLGIEVLPGIDLSSWNGAVDFKKVADAGIKYAWVKVTEGQTHINREWARKFKEARDNGIIVGGYHFGRSDHNVYDNPQYDAEKEAEHFLSAMENVGICSGDLVPALDVEKGMKTDDQYNVEWCLKWLEVVEKQLSCNVKPIVYTAKWAWDLFLRKANKEDLQKLTQYPIWWASYNKGVEPKRNVCGWKEWDVWQHGSDGAVSGIRGKVDVNWLAGGQLDKLKVT